MKYNMKKNIPLSWRLHMYLSEKYKTDGEFFNLLINKVCKNKPQLKFIQIGANDGISCDPIHEFVKKYNWNGVLIEPEPKVFKLLQKNYIDNDNLIFENMAITDYKGEISLSFSNDPSLDSNKLFSTVTPQKGILSRSNYINSIETIQVPCDTLENICIKHALLDFDLLLIDVEGYENNLINSIDFKKVRPSIIHFEHAHITYNEHQNIIDYLRKFGYKTFFEKDNSTSIRY
jgi:FkbM family methyltransferase